MNERKTAVVFLVTALLCLFFAMSVERMWANETHSCDPRAYDPELRHKLSAEKRAGNKFWRNYESPPIIYEDVDGDDTEEFFCSPIFLAKQHIKHNTES
eukprot:TRINITY_DN3254_c0_g1_i1.p2 TRINITY_DN3254_c0_g1~~TRINITY_DN3254_c0_g1_i1.p2  ORF type:complete len:113 (-),score=32.05 TRINITY_DN3254_c0_g1_i1:2-298(-)